MVLGRLLKFRLSDWVVSTTISVSVSTVPEVLNLQSSGLFHHYTMVLQADTPWILSFLIFFFSIKTPVARRARQYLIEHFSINLNSYDLIIGYRADDSYFDFAESFLNNAITVEQLAGAIRLGKLGEQIVLKSKFAFSKIKFDGFEPAAQDLFWIQRKSRDEEAGQSYLDLREEETDGLYIQDLIRGGISNDDPRIPRNLSE